MKAVKHIKAAEPFSSERQTKLDFPKRSDHAQDCITTSEAEGRLSMYIAIHAAFLTVGHLSEACKNSFCDSKPAPNMRLHRIKCKNFIVNIFAPHFLDSLKDDIGDAKYSLLIDESTDIAVIKLLGVTIRYYSKTLQKIVSTYLGLVEIESGTAECIVSAIKKFLNKFNLDPQNLLGIGVDNASVNTGINNGVCELAKRELALPNLVVI